MPRGRPRKNAAGAAVATPAPWRGRANNRPQVPFAHKLVLNQWLLSLFDYNTDKPEADQIAPFDEADEAWPQLNKLADAAVAAENRPARLPDGAPLDDVPNTSAE